MKPRKEQIITARLTLKSLTKEDKNDFIEIVKNPDVKKTYMLPDFINQEEEDKFYERITKLSVDNNRFVYGIYSKNKIIGFINEVAKENNEIEIGYFIDKNEWNKGYATEALKAAIEELFRIGFSSVVSGFFEENIASERVMQKCGMLKMQKEEIIIYQNKEHHCLYYQIKKCLS